jgi:ribosome modulation factor
MPDYSNMQLTPSAGTEGARTGGNARAFRSPEQAYDAGYEAFNKGIPKSKVPESFRDHWLGGWNEGKHHQTGVPPEDD